MIKVAYCAGHGINTPGKRTPDGEREWSFNNIVASAFAKELALYKGVIAKRFDDPTGLRDVPLAERTNGANSWGADYYISFHHNAFQSIWGTHTGVETYVYNGNMNMASGKLAKAIHPTLVNAYGLRDRGIKEGNFHIVRETKMPAILIEGGFMDSIIDIKKLRDKKLLENVGISVARAFAKFVSLEKAIGEESKNDNGQIVKEEIIVAQQFLNETGRKEAKEMIRRGIEEKLFTGKHENLDQYDDIQLLSYALAYINRKFKK